MNNPKEIEIPMGHHRLSYVLSGPVLVSLGGTPIKTLEGSGTAVLRRVSGILEFDYTEPKKRNEIMVVTRPVELYEEMDNVPPPAPAEPDNYLARLREQVRLSMGVVRENFAQRTSIYEIGEVDKFEEDLIEEEKQSRQEKAEEAKRAKAAKDAQGDEGSSGSSSQQKSGDQPSSAAEPQPRGGSSTAAKGENSQ